MGYTVYGPYYNGDGRGRVVLYKDKKRRTMSYPKFLWWKEKGELIDDNQEIHHRNEDFTDNRLDNFVVMTRKEHRRRHMLPAELLKCAWCSADMLMYGIKLSRRKTECARGKAGPFCSRKCSGEYGAARQQQLKIDKSRGYE